MYSKLNNITTPEVSDTTGVDHETNARKQKSYFFLYFIKADNRYKTGIKRKGNTVARYLTMAPEKVMV